MKGPAEGTVLRDRLEATIRRFRMFSQGDTIGVAVSGGRDSICLLDILTNLASDWKLRLIVLHVNHGLRPESGDEEKFVRALAGQHGLECFVDHPKLNSGNLEEEARNARLQFFESAPCDRVATAHTRSDQAETVLFRILRGSGTAGLVGIHPVWEKLIRPMIDITREDVDAWIAFRGLQYCEDASNQSDRFSRNRIRHHLLPQLREEWNPRIEDALANTAAIAAQEEDFFESQLPPFEIEPDGSVVVKANLILKGHPALARRMIRRAILLVKGDLNRIDFAHIEKILSMRLGHDRVILPGVDILRSFEWMRFAAERLGANPERNWSVDLAVPGKVELPGNQFVSIEFQPPSCRYNENVCRLSSEAVDKPLILRNWQPGDRVFVERDNAAIRIKQLFQEHRIPLWERRNWPVLEAAGEIIWAGEFGSVLSKDDGPFIQLTRFGRSYRPMMNQIPSNIRLKN